MRIRTFLRLDSVLYSVVRGNRNVHFHIAPGRAKMINGYNNFKGDKRVVLDHSETFIAFQTHHNDVSHVIIVINNHYSNLHVEYEIIFESPDVCRQTF